METTKRKSLLERLEEQRLYANDGKDLPLYRGRASAFVTSQSELQSTITEIEKLKEDAEKRLEKHKQDSIERADKDLPFSWHRGMAKKTKGEIKAFNKVLSLLKGGAK